MSASSSIEHLSDESFTTQVKNTPELCVVDFWAPWCGPCRTIAPILEEFAKVSAGQIRVFKLDVDAHPEQAQAHQVQSIPTLIFFKNGKEVARRSGMVQLSGLQEMLEKVR